MVYADQDGDGFTVAQGVEQCIGLTPPAGYLLEPTAFVDCDDTSASVNPLATEVYDDDIDQDCDGEDPSAFPDDVIYVNSADPDCQDDFPGIVDAPNCSIESASDRSLDGDTIWVAADGTYPTQTLNPGRIYLGGFDAAGGWVRDTATHRTVVNETWVEPIEILPGVWAAGGGVISVRGEALSDTVIEGFELVGERGNWGASLVLGMFMVSGETYVRDCVLVAGMQDSDPLAPMESRSSGVESFFSSLHMENVEIDAGGGKTCWGINSGGGLSLDNVNIRGCDGADNGTGLIVGSGAAVVSDTLVELGSGITTATGIRVQGEGAVFTTATVVRADASGDAVALDVEGPDTRMESKNSAFIASRTGAAMGRGARVADSGTLIAAGTLFNGGVGDDVVAVEALTGTLTLLNGLLDGGDSTTGSSTALEVTQLANVTLVANNLWGTDQSALVDESGLQLTTVADLDQCAWAACLESRLNTSFDPEFQAPGTASFSVAPTSPAVDSGVDPSPYGLIVSRDIAGLAVPSDGDGDSVAEFDRGPHER